MKPWFIVIFCVVAGHMFVVHALVRKSGLQWEATMQANNSSRNKNQASCLKVSDFYSVHLTSYFLPSTDNSAEARNDKTKKYDQFCDRIPGEGLVVFTVDLMEQDTRDLPVALSFSQYDSRGQLKLVKEIPPQLYPRGVLSLDTPIQEQGNYLLKVAFGESKTKDDIIEMPIIVGQEDLKK
jgi:hypothetical protein